MTQYDGSIRICTGIDVKGFEDGKKKLEVDARSAAKSIDASIKQMEKEFDTLDKSIWKTAQTITSLTLKSNKMRDLRISTNEYTAAQKDVEKLEKSLLDAYTRKEKFLQTGGDRSSRTFKNIEYDIDKLETKLRLAEEDLQSLVRSGKAFTLGSDTEQFTNISNQIEDLTHKMQDEQQRAAQLQSDIQSKMQEKIQAEAAEEERLTKIRENAVVGNQRIVEAVEERKQLLQEIADMEAAGIGHGYQQHDLAVQRLVSVEQEIRDYNNGIEEVKENYRKLGQIAKNVLSSMARTVSNTLSSAFKSFGNVAKKSLSSLGLLLKRATSSMLSFGKSTKSTNNILGAGFKNILKYGLGIRSLFALINKLRSAIKEGFTNLYNGSESFKNTIDELRASALTLQNSFAAAFRPLVEVAVPYIKTLLDYMTQAVNAAGQLMAALFGRNTYTKAIKQTTAALKEETKASNKQLSSLDKLNNLTSKKDSGADGGAAGMFEEEVPISDKWKNIAQWLKDMWENSDFYELGKLLGEKLKEALDNIPWDKIKETARKIGKSIATFINGFVEVEGLGYSIGKTLAEAINTGFEFLNAFVHNLHWDSIGKFIAETINGFFTNIDWNLIYDTFVTGAKGLGDAINAFVDYLDWEAISNSVSNFFNTFVDTIYTFVTTVDWKKFGEKVGKTISDAFTGIDWKKAGETVSEVFKAFFSFVTTAIENVDWWAVGESVKNFLVGIDWAGVAEAFFEAIGAALGGLAAFLGGLIAEGVVSAGEYFQDKIEEAGGNVVEGILVGIAEALVGIGEWIKEHVFKPFMDGFKKAFEIHSPSKAMESIGRYIIDGLLNGLKDSWKNIVSWITDKINWLKEKLSGMAGSFKSAFSGGGFGSRSTGAGGASRMSTASTYAINPAFATLAAAPIPKLATGAVIPPNKEFLAVLGDQKRGTNIEAPLATIEEAVINAMAKVNSGNNNNGGTVTIEIPVILNGNEIGRAMQQFSNEFFKQNGKPAFA